MLATPPSRANRREPAPSPRGMLLVTMALVAAGLLAGCSTPGGQGFAEGQMSAEEAIGLAQNQAVAWSPDAKLASATAAEVAPGSSMLEDLSEGTATVPEAFVRLADGNPDPNVGDGKAPFWALVFVAEDQPEPMRVVAYASNGTVRPLGLPVAPQSADGPLGAWSTGSQQAVEAALENTTFRASTEADDGGLLLTLLPSGPEADHTPTWSLLSTSSSQGTTSFLFVDGRTGQASTLDDLIREAAEERDQEQAADRGASGPTVAERLDGVATVHTFQANRTAQAPAPVHEVPVEEGDTWFQVSYRFTDDGPSPISGRAEARDPSGSLLISEHSGGGNQGYQAIFAVQDPGTYTTSLAATFQEEDQGRSYEATVILWPAANQDPAFENTTEEPGEDAWELAGTFRPTLVPAIPQHPIGQMAANTTLVVNLTWPDQGTLAFEPLLVDERGIGHGPVEQTTDPEQGGQAGGELQATFEVEKQGAYWLTVVASGVEDPYAPVTYGATIHARPGAPS